MIVAKNNKMKNFDYNLKYAELNLREHPHLYAIGSGE